MPTATAEPIPAELQPQPAAHADGGRKVRLPTGAIPPLSTLAVAGVLCFATFEAGGGLRLSSMTVFEIALTLVGGLTVAGAVVLGPRGRPAYGTWSLGLLLAFTALTAMSVGWSVVPDSSWEDAGRMLSYSAVFAAALTLARLCPRAWSGVLAGIVLSAVAICAYALLTKVLPRALDPHDIYARLQEPYGYWNSVGLTAALGAVGCLWLGARRSGHALLSASAYPALGLLLVTLMLAYSRGALVALAIGLALWLAIVPLRLRGARVLIVGALGAAPVVVWAFATHSLSSENVSLAARTSAGRQLGVLLVAMLLLLSLAGIAIGFQSSRRPPSRALRRRAGAVLIAALVLAVVGFAGGLALSKRGFTGSISHSFRSLTDPNAPVPPNTPGRLTAIGSVRARYWKEALDVFAAHPAFGAGASGYETARLRYRKETLDVKHAHGYVVQTLSDLGIVGLSLALALLAVWLVSAARATLPLDRRLTMAGRPTKLLGGRLSIPSGVSWGRVHAPYTPERIGLLSMLCIVVVFGVHSFADWTWYVPGNACVALLGAGWLAGRGPLARRGVLAERSPLAEHGGEAERGRLRAAGDSGRLDDTLVLPGAPGARDSRLARLNARSLPLAALIVALALVGAWTEWQPQRSAVASEEALALLSRNPAAARAAARSAVERDPLSASALFTLATVQNASGERAQGRLTLEKAVRLQPSNPQAWLELGLYDRHARPRAAVGELRAAVYLDPRSVSIQNAYVEALRAAPPPPPASARKRRRAAPTNQTRTPAARRTRAATPGFRNAGGLRLRTGRGALQGALLRCRAAAARSRSRPAGC